MQGATVPIGKGHTVAIDSKKNTGEKIIPEAVEQFLWRFNAVRLLSYSFLWLCSYEQGSADVRLMPAFSIISHQACPMLELPVLATLLSISTCCACPPSARPN
jgi:hypothetical protein